MAKFKTLISYGVIFPEHYVAKGYTVNGIAIPNEGDDSSEEMLYAYAGRVLDTDYEGNKVLNKNFYKCLKPTLTKDLQNLAFPEDFMPTLKKMKKDIEVAKEAKKAYQKNNKSVLEKAKEETKAKYGFAILDGVKQPVAYAIEGPGLFIQRGAGPILGVWKYRPQPEDITINYCPVPESTWNKLNKADKAKLMENAPKAPEGHEWGAIEHNYNAMHIAIYKENLGGITEKIKELRFGNASSVKAEADQKKFAKAAKLLCHMKEMEKHIHEGMESSDKLTRECALVSWLIQTTGIRIGNERDLDLQADTVGASTLKKENIWYEEGKIHLHFLGKDYVPYDNAIEAPVYVGKAIERLRKTKNAGEQVFDCSSDDVAKFLSECVEGCTPKLFRTAIASKLLVDAFKEQKVTKSMTVREKLHAFDMANLAVATKLNHKRALPKNFDEQLTKLDTQIQSAIDKEEETTAKVKENLAKIEKQTKKYKANLTGTALTKALKTQKDKKAKEQAKLDKATEKIASLKEKRDFKAQTGSIALSTSKTNYITPQLAYSICNDLDIPVEKILTKTLQEKFAWAKDTPKNYWRKYPEV